MGVRGSMRVLRNCMKGESISVGAEEMWFWGNSSAGALKNKWVFVRNFTGAENTK